MAVGGFTWRNNALHVTNTANITAAQLMSTVNSAGSGIVSAPPPRPAARQDEFKGVGFETALGEIYGLRCWRLDSAGRLRARNLHSVPAWRPGVNKAACYAAGPTSYGQTVANLIDPFGRGRTARYASEVVGGSLTSEPAFEITWDDGSISRLRFSEMQFKSHTDPAPVEGCTCGFYAYTDLFHPDSEPEPGEEQILGAIKGSGRTLIGSKGFRCEKAEIIALVNPMSEERTLTHLKQKRLLEHVYPGIPLLDGREALLEFTPLESEKLPDPTDERFWLL